MDIRDYQSELAEKGKLILNKYGLLYLAFEMRVGKTLVSLLIAHLVNAKHVLFLTKKKAIKDIQNQYEALHKSHKMRYTFTLTNYESLHNVQRSEFDLIICDEAHGLGAYPKPAVRTQKLKNFAYDSKIIYLSGTPTPESYSQLYHQFWISRKSPFGAWDNFYKWVKAGFVLVTEKRISGHIIRDYSNAIQSQVEQYTNKLFLSYTQKDAGFKVSRLNDSIRYVEPDKRIRELIKILIKDKVYTFKDGAVLVCDTAAKLQRKVHQIYSGTVIVDEAYKPQPDRVEAKIVEREHRILDYSKANYIKEHFLGKKKIAIFYLFIAEGDALKKTLINWTADPEHFNNTTEHVVFLGQFQSSSRGINLSSADVILFYNIHFSSELYQQARQRGQEKEKSKKTELIWLFTQNGIEDKIYSRVINKQSYTTSYFRKDYL